ncbi:MAG: glycoside hydrolase family 3 C-terminal domain-containing protein [Fibrobacter sp.]|nr:glycoside hydrolase family 3 C-terminal domain-containing protein [Fibrobacter sp.]
MFFPKIGISAIVTLAVATAVQAGIKGAIVDESGNPVHNAAVTIRVLPNLVANARTLTNDKGAFNLNNAKKGQSIVVRKAGFLPETLSVVPAKKDYGNITLKRDPIENRIDSIIAKMTIDDMIAQMTQAKAPAVKCGNSICGSALEGGGAYTADFYANAWKQKIPVIYGKDNVHGVADVNGATIFPHNIGLGATRDSALVRKIGQAVAEEMWAAHIDLNFAPAITVPQDERWGRVYEGFSENTELVANLGAAFVRGQQGDHNDAEWRVITTLKHFIGDGATNKGYDRGNATMTNKVLHQKYLPPYEAAIEQGALSVMASFNQVNGIHQHVDSALLTGVLKTELAFDGYVIADWEGIESSTTPGAAGDYSPGLVTGISSKDAIKNSINAGLDMAMVPQSAEAFVSNMKELVASGAISEERVKDACRRILRAKIRAGRIDNPNGPAAYVGITKNIGSAEHRQLAREAVQKSLVVLKNKKVLPLATTDKIFVTGSHANNTGLQCGAWTLGWQGTMEEVPGATSIQAGFDEVAKGALVATAEEAGTIVYVIGEVPYAEWFGDYRGNDFNNKIITKKARTDMSFDSTDENIAQIKQWQKAGHKVAVVLITGRPLPITSLINAADAFVVAWLPGSEGAGVADVLFGKVKPTGKLPHTWPKDAKQIPINVGDGKKGLYPYGFGLTY